MTDVDDLYVDSLKEQAAELGISLDEVIPESPSSNQKSGVKKKFDPKAVPKTAKKEVDQLKEEIKEEKKTKEELQSL